ncbi:hypothetical protein [Moorena producens]|uniref:hypothetical protein n=1 Tax=Moorena producens TaxID=1155739 RepID=UPI001875F9BB|nr:hypothetical protein [Moorena producens]
MQSASGGNHGSRSWGKPPRPRCLPKTALHRFLITSKTLWISFLLPTPYSQIRCSLFPTPCSLLPAPFSYKSDVHNSNKNGISLLTMRYFQGVKNNGTRLFTEPSLELD